MASCQSHRWLTFFKIFNANVTKKETFSFHIHTFLCKHAKLTVQVSAQVTHLDGDDGLELLILNADGFGSSLGVKLRVGHHHADDMTHAGHLQTQRMCHHPG